MLLLRKHNDEGLEAMVFDEGLRRMPPRLGQLPGLHGLEFLDEILVTGWAVVVPKTAGYGINPRCVTIGFFGEPSAHIVMDEPTSRTNLQLGWIL